MSVRGFETHLATDIRTMFRIWARRFASLSVLLQQWVEYLVQLIDFIDHIPELFDGVLWATRADLGRRDLRVAGHFDRREKIVRPIQKR